MSNVRRRRLGADRTRMEKAFRDHPRIRVVKVQGNPPDRYQLEYRLKGLTLKGERVVKRDRHLVEVYLTTGYPRQAPQGRMLTPAFHPNIDTSAICIGDHWAAGESLVNLVVRIGEMLALQSYNTKSPLNGEAARWCDRHQHLLPVDEVDLRPESLLEAESETVRADAAAQSPAAPAAEDASGDRVLRARPVKSGGPEGRAVRAKPVAKGRLVSASGGKGETPSGERPIVACSCGRRYRPRRPKPFRCLGCGKTIDPAGRA